MPSKTTTSREDDKLWYDSEIRRNQRKRDRLKKTGFISGNQNDWKNTNITEKGKQSKRHAKEYFYNNLDITVSDFQKNDKRKFWKVIRHFVKNNDSSYSISPL